jgi:hypothetical protein
MPGSSHHRQRGRIGDGSAVAIDEVGRRIKMRPISERDVGRHSLIEDHSGGGDSQAGNRLKGATWIPLCVKSGGVCAPAQLTEIYAVGDDDRRGSL